MHFCANCGEQVKDECRFCPKCGALQSGRSHNNKIRPKRVHKKKVSKLWYNSKTIPFNINTQHRNLKTAIQNPIIIGAIIGLLIIIIVLGGSCF